MILLLLELLQARRIRTYPSDGTLVNPFPFHLRYPKCVPMKPVQIPYYAPDGTSLGFRTLEVAKRLIEGGFAKPSYGRKGHLKAILRELVRRRMGRDLSVARKQGFTIPVPVPEPEPPARDWRPWLLLVPLLLLAL